MQNFENELKALKLKIRNRINELRGKSSIDNTRLNDATHITDCKDVSMINRNLDTHKMTIKGVIQLKEELENKNFPSLDALNEMGIK